MDKLPSLETLQALLADGRGWLFDNVFTLSSLLQLALVLLTWILARSLAAWLSGRLERLIAGRPWSDKLRLIARPCYLPTTWLALTGIAMAGLVSAGLPYYVLSITASLLLAWIVIGLATSLVRNPELSRLIQFAAWGIAALNIVGLLGPTVDLLNAAAIDIGTVRLSLLALITGVITLAVLIWGSLALSGFVERRLASAAGITPALQVLFGKISRITLITLAIVIGLGSAGIDLTAFAVFGGAIGVGIGFGLQKVVSNLISGVILLLDRSIKPGDVIEVGGTYGWINALAARYISVITRDGTEHLIPNEDMITRPVINWTYSHTRVRRHIALNVSYSSDLHRAMALMAEAADETDRVIANPAPKTLVRGFGDNGIDLELRMWINDPQHGVSNVASDVMLKIWDKFNAAGIEFPYPQRDVHLISEES